MTTRQQREREIRQRITEMQREREQAGVRTDRRAEVYKNRKIRTKMRLIQASEMPYIPNYQETLFFKLAESENWVKDFLVLEMENHVEFCKTNDPVGNPIAKAIRAEIFDWVAYNLRFIVGMDLEEDNTQLTPEEIQNNIQIQQLNNIGYRGVETLHDCMLSSDYEDEQLREIILNYDKVTFINKMILPALQDLYLHARDHAVYPYTADLAQFLNSSKLMIFESLPVVYEVKIHKPHPIVLLDRETKPIEIRLSTQEWRTAHPPRVIQPGQILPAIGLVALFLTIQTFIYRVVSVFGRR